MNGLRVASPMVALCIVVACSVACGSTPERSSPVVGTTTSPASTPPWVVQSESESRTYVTNRCWEVAPPTEVEARNPDFEECRRRSDQAAEQAWRTLGDEALARCEKSGDECCFARVPADYQRVLPNESRVQFHSFQERVDACNAACAKSLGHRAKPMACSPEIITTPTDPNRVLTPELVAIVTACKNGDFSALQRCRSLRGTPSRLRCNNECEVALLGSTPKPERELREH